MLSCQGEEGARGEPGPEGKAGLPVCNVDMFLINNDMLMDVS